MMSFGSCPEITLADATSRLAEAVNTFEAVARHWLAVTGANRKPKTNRKIERLLDKDIFPYFGDVPIAEITAQSALPVFVMLC
jgi:hypothetical protein